MKIFEGYFDVVKGQPNVDADHGPCQEYLIPELGVTVFLYKDSPSMISVHPIEDTDETARAAAEKRTARIASVRRSLVSYARMDTHDTSSRKEWADLRKEYEELMKPGVK